ncbi:hypothetical protein NKJ46_11880 [Mesorhizobium sp. M0166]|uniref:hypothetical protein n=1 Tax=Mesorhizobium sp. M0166 TaxID=2956902 RepID=UPI00333C9558
MSTASPRASLEFGELGLEPGKWRPDDEPVAILAAKSDGEGDPGAVLRQRRRRLVSGNRIMRQAPQTERRVVDDGEQKLGVIGHIEAAAVGLGDVDETRCQTGKTHAAARGARHVVGAALVHRLQERAHGAHRARLVDTDVLDGADTHPCPPFGGGGIETAHEAAAVGRLDEGEGALAVAFEPVADKLVAFGLGLDAAVINRVHALYVGAGLLELDLGAAAAPLRVPHARPVGRVLGMRLRHDRQQAGKRECADQRDRPDQQKQQPILCCRRKGVHSVALLLAGDSAGPTREGYSA